MTSTPRIGGLVLAAGAGTRLRPLTDTTPKPLLTVLDKPLLASAVSSLGALGVQDIHVNLSHLAESMASFIEARWPGAIRYRTEDRLSGPAGALNCFADCWPNYDAVVVVSGDVVFQDDLRGLLHRHLAEHSDLTFAARRVTHARRFGVLQTDERSRVTQTVEKPDVPDDEEHTISAGIYCLSPAAIARIPADTIYDYAANLAPDLIYAGRKVFAQQIDGYWNDVGTLESLRDANLHMAIDSSSEYGGLTSVYVSKDAAIGEGTKLVGPCVVSAGARVGRGCHLARTVIMPGAVVPDGSVLEDELVPAASRPITVGAGT